MGQKVGISDRKKVFEIQTFVFEFLGVKLNLFREISCFILFYLGSCFNHDMSRLITFHSCFYPVFADNSRKSCHNKQVVEKTYHNHVSVTLISITILSRISWSLKRSSHLSLVKWFKIISGINSIFFTNSSWIIMWYI